MASFEDKLAELEKVVERLERGELTLEDNVSLFERGMHLSNDCKKELDRAESRIQVLLDPVDEAPIRTAPLNVELANDEDEDEEYDADYDDGRL